MKTVSIPMEIAFRPNGIFDFAMAITSSDDDNGMFVFCMFDADGDGITIANIPII